MVWYHVAWTGKACDYSLPLFARVSGKPGGMLPGYVLYLDGRPIGARSYGPQPFRFIEEYSDAITLRELVNRGVLTDLQQIEEWTNEETQPPALG